MDFQYKVSVIVPVYNVEEYLRDCLDSLVAQTIDHRLMEVLLINDGSTDNSLEICNEYAENYSVFKVFSKDNEGLSATRNYGIKRAQGKYMMYLDSDDMFAPETVEAVTNFFDTVYDQVDLVTYLDQRYRNGVKLNVHFRYKYLTKSGVYDLNQLPYITQTRVSVCVKNMGEDNHLFDTNPEFRHEDQEYNNHILSKKFKIGFCNKGEYIYNRNETSIMSIWMYPLYIFESSMAYYEKLFESFNGNVPRYIQAMYLHDLNWKLAGNVLYPFHYEGEQFEKAVDRVHSLLKFVDSDLIVNHPSIDNFHKHYWLSLKENAHPCVIMQRDGASVCLDGESIYSRKNFEIILHKIRIENNEVHLMGFVKSPIFNYYDEKPCVKAIINNGNVEKELDLFLSVHSFYKAKVITNKFWAFKLRYNVEELHNLTFSVSMDGVELPITFWVMPVGVFNSKLGINSYVRENFKLTLKNKNEITFEKLDRDQIEAFELEQTEKFNNVDEIYNLRKESLEYRKTHRIWLYSDLYTVKKDNGYYQFINDFTHDDGVERYYVYDRDYDDIADLFTEEQKKYLVQFGSDKHKLLYLSAEYVLSSFFGFSPISPFKTESNEANYLDIIKFKTIYLQHGVLHASLYMQNAAERCRADKIVVSSFFEIDNYINNYNYDRCDVVPTGMSRYDHIDRKAPAKNRILFAPSWRNYLTASDTPSKWTTIIYKLLHSDYYNNICSFLNNSSLHKILEEKDLYLDFKPHPIFFEEVRDIFNFSSDRIIVTKSDVNVTDYKMFITDFSSYAFDYACLSRPIMYFVPDMPQFKSGMNHYRELDLTWDNAFGNLTTDAEGAVNEVCRIINNDFAPDLIFKERMDNFYLPLENCSEKLYAYLIGEKES